MRRPSPSEPVSELRRVKIRESGEPMVDFSTYCPRLVIAAPVYGYTRATLVRQTVADMLNLAVEVLPPGYSLGILEGWRPNYIQRRMHLTQWLRFKELHPDWSDLQLRRVVNRYTHPHNAAAPPPHASGGAVDVMLCDADGNRLDHSTPYRVFDPKNYGHATPGLSDKARLHRRILREALLFGGLTNYPSEYWHWSFGDQGWAYRLASAEIRQEISELEQRAFSKSPGGLAIQPGPELAERARAIRRRVEGIANSAGDGVAPYGPIYEPKGWSPIPADDVDEVLERLWGGGEGSGFVVAKGIPSDSALSDM